MDGAGLATSSDHGREICLQAPVEHNRLKQRIRTRVWKNCLSVEGQYWPHLLGTLRQHIRSICKSSWKVAVNK